MKMYTKPPGTYRQTVDTVKAILWATHQEGDKPWKGTSVTTLITKYLDKHGARTSEGKNFSSTDVANAMQHLDKFGYATLKRAGKNIPRYVEFIVHRNVDTAGWVPPYVYPSYINMNGNEPEPAPESSHSEPAKPQRKLKPVSIGETYRLNEFTALCRKMAKKDPDEWQAWVDEAIAQFASFFVGTTDDASEG